MSGLFSTEPREVGKPDKHDGQCFTTHDLGFNTLPPLCPYLQYYPLDVSYFKSRTDKALLDALWDSYWVGTLCAAPLAQSRSLTTGRIQDISRKLANLNDALSKGAPSLQGERKQAGK